MSASDELKSAGTIVVTLVIFVLVASWSVAVWQNLGSVPVYNEDGTVKLDKFARAKDLFVLVLPLLTTAVGYWLGSQGTAKAEGRADRAEAQKSEVETQRSKAEAQKSAIFAVSNDPELMIKARNVYPEAFE